MQISARKKKKERGQKKRRVRAETKLNIFLAKKGLELGSPPGDTVAEERGGREIWPEIKKVHEFTGREEFRT